MYVFLGFQKWIHHLYLDINLHRNFLDGMMVNFDFQIDKIYNYHGKKSLRKFMIGYLDLVFEIEKSTLNGNNGTSPWV